MSSFVMIELVVLAVLNGGWFYAVRWYSRELEKLRYQNRELKIEKIELRLELLHARMDAIDAQTDSIDAYMQVLALTLEVRQLRVLLLHIYNRMQLQGQALEYVPRVIVDEDGNIL